MKRLSVVSLVCAVVALAFNTTAIASAEVVGFTASPLKAKLTKSTRATHVVGLELKAQIGTSLGAQPAPLEGITLVLPVGAILDGKDFPTCQLVQLTDTGACAKGALVGTGTATAALTPTEAAEGTLAVYNGGAHVLYIAAHVASPLNAEIVVTCATSRRGRSEVITCHVPLIPTFPNQAPASITSFAIGLQPTTRVIHPRRHHASTVAFMNDAIPCARSSALTATLAFWTPTFTAEGESVTKLITEPLCS